VPKRLVRLGRVRGYRPTRVQLEEMLELAQRGMGEAATAKLIFHNGDEEVYPSGELSRISPDNIAEIIRDAEHPTEFTNLEFLIEQALPDIRSIEIYVGPEDWTEYRVESDDQTWALGRHHELTDKLLLDRSPYVKGRVPSPEIWGRNNSWHSAAWESVYDRRSSTVVNSVAFIIALLASEVLLFAFIMTLYFMPDGSAGGTSKSAAPASIDLSGHSIFILTLLTIACLVGLLALRRRLASIFESKVILQKPTLLAQFSFQTKGIDPIGLASFYVSASSFIITVIALVIH
jgi:hypothetical protein